MEHIERIVLCFQGRKRLIAFAVAFPPSLASTLAKAWMLPLQQVGGGRRGWEGKKAGEK